MPEVEPVRPAQLGQAAMELEAGVALATKAVTALVCLAEVVMVVARAAINREGLIVDGGQSW